MDVLKNFIKNIGEKWNGLNKWIKIGSIAAVAVIIVSLLFVIVFSNKPKYDPLFLNMSTEDMAKVVDQLKQNKVDYKLNGDTILVPADKVQELRLSVAGSGTLPSNGKGYELFDQSRFGMTDTETKIQYQRALETELQRTIKAFDAVEQAIVHLVIPDTSVFVRDQEKASASVTLKLKKDKKLTDQQVKAIVALISSSVKDLPKENVVVVDSNYNYLSEELYNEDVTSDNKLANRQEIKKQFESKLENDIRKMLESVYGSGKVKVTVNADMDFDSKQTTSIHYDKDSIIKNQNTIKETTTGTGTQVSGSPIDNQTSAVTDSGNTTNQKNHEEATTNYAVGQVEEKTISAPGKINRMSTSVLVDGTLSDTAKASVTNLVMAATGYVNDSSRKDLISVEGMNFDNSIKNKVDEDLKAMQNTQNADQRKMMLYLYIGIPLVAIALIVLAIILIAKARAKKAKERAEAGEGIDLLVDQPVPVNEIIQAPPIILDEDDGKPDLVDELKKYANKKPDQVLEIIKSWLAEDER